jgi:hypothetical protein
MYSSFYDFMCDLRLNRIPFFTQYPPDQTFALVLVPASTKIGDTFCVFLPSAVAPLRHPQNSQNGARAEGDKIKCGGAFFTLRCAPVLTFLGVALGLLELFSKRWCSGQLAVSAVGQF